MGPGLDRDVREALAIFADELSAHRYLEQMLWPDGVHCPRCHSTRVGKLNGASTRLGTFKCYGCRKAFSLLHGTVMSSSHVPAHKWLQAIYLTDCGTRPVPTQHLQEILNVTFKTAASMRRRISEAAEACASEGSGVATAWPRRNVLAKPPVTAHVGAMAIAREARTGDSGSSLAAS